MNDLGRYFKVRVKMFRLKVKYMTIERGRMFNLR